MRRTICSLAAAALLGAPALVASDFESVPALKARGFAVFEMRAVK